MTQEAAAAARAGCMVLRFRGSPRRSRIVCPGGWGAARLLVELAREDLDDERGAIVAAIGRELRRAYPDARACIGAIHAFVVSFVAFAPEEGERFQHPAITLATSIGDCDCHARLVVALLRSAGVPARFAFFSAPGATGPRHVVAQGLAGDRWVWLETTVPGAMPGDNPIAAALRAHVIRDDVAPQYSEVTTMGELGTNRIEAGRRYRMRLRINDGREDLAIEPADYVMHALEAAGLSYPHVWIDPSYLPCDWPADQGRDEENASSFTAWAEASLDSGETRELDSLDDLADVVAIWDIGPSPSASASIESTPATPASIGDVVDASPGAIVQTKDLPDAFFAKLKAIASDLRIRPEWLLNVMMVESGIHAWAAYRHPPDLATGLIQMVSPEKYGFRVAQDALANHDAFARLSELEQLPYVAAYYAPMKGRVSSGTTLYQWNFLPASIARGTGPATVILASDGTGYGGHEARWYQINRGLDHDGDGRITVADIDTHLEIGRRSARYVEALERLRSAPSSSSIAVAGAVPLLLAGAYAIRELLRG